MGCGGSRRRRPLGAARWTAAAVALLAVAGCTGTIREDAPAEETDGGGVMTMTDAGGGDDAGTGTDGGPAVDAGGGGGTDAGGTGCPAGQTSCLGSCVNTSTDPDNCGACGRGCATGATCSGGTCMGGEGCAPAPGGSSADASAALELENEVRLAMGVPCATMVPEINTSAQNHCDYYSANSGACVSSPHQEMDGCTGFTGVNFADRMRAAGYTGAPAMEDMHFIGNGAAAVQGWIDSVWHRTPVLSPWIRDIGYGGTSGCDTMDFGSGASAPSDLVAVYPYPNQTSVPTSFDGRREGPNPPAPDTGWPSGYPITVYLRGDVTEHVLTVDGSSTPIDHLWIARGSSLAMGLLRNEHVLYANDPLSSGTTYRVHIVGSNGGGPVDLEWTFTTR